MALRFVAVVCVFASMVNSLAYKAPRATNVAASQEFDGRGWSPAPTPGPHELLIRNLFNLEGRVKGTTILVAEDQTCGYLSGRAGAGYSCAGTSTCNLFTDAGFIGCCGSTACSAHLFCLNSVEYYSKSGVCNDVCEADTFTLKCTDSASPFCNTATWPEVGVTDVYCAPKSVSSVQIYSTNFNGQTFGGHFTPEVLTGTETSIPTTSPTSSPSPPSTTSPSPDPTPFNTTPLLPPTQTTTVARASKKSTPIGPIVGGAVGGVALLAAIGFGIWFIIRHNKKKSNNQEARASHPPQYASEMGSSYGGGKPPAAVNQQEFYPNMNAPVSPNMQYQAPVQGYFNQEQQGPNPNLSPKPAAEQFGDRTQTISPSPVSPGRDSYVSAAPEYHDHTMYPPNVHEVHANPIERGTH